MVNPRMTASNSLYVFPLWNFPAPFHLAKFSILPAHNYQHSHIFHELKLFHLLIVHEGRISPSRLFLVIPAHFLGCVFGTVLFKTLCPIAPSSVRKTFFSNWGLVILCTFALYANVFSSLFNFACCLKKNDLISRCSSLSAMIHTSGYRVS